MQCTIHVPVGSSSLDLCTCLYTVTKILVREEKPSCNI